MDLGDNSVLKFNRGFITFIYIFGGNGPQLLEFAIYRTKTQTQKPKLIVRNSRIIINDKHVYDVICVLRYQRNLHAFGIPQRQRPAIFFFFKAQKIVLRGKLPRIIYMVFATIMALVLAL